jgi:hypothetical protein
MVSKSHCITFWAGSEGYDSRFFFLLLAPESLLGYDVSDFTDPLLQIYSNFCANLLFSPFFRNFADNRLLGLCPAPGQSSLFFFELP